MLRNLVLEDLSAEDGLRYYLFSNEKKKHVSPQCTSLNICTEALK